MIPVGGDVAVNDVKGYHSVIVKMSSCGCGEVGVCTGSYRCGLGQKVFGQPGAESLPTHAAPKFIISTRKTRLQ